MKRLALIILCCNLSVTFGLIALALWLDLLRKPDLIPTVPESEAERRERLALEQMNRFVNETTRRIGYQRKDEK